MSRGTKRRRFDAIRDLQHVAPVDPGEVAHVMHALRQELDPALIREAARLGPGGRRYERGLAARLRLDLAAIVGRRDAQDWAEAIASDPAAPPIERACAQAACALRWLEDAARSQAAREPEGGELSVLAWTADWARLRAALTEIALALTASELADESERFAAARGLADVGERFRSGRKRGALAAHNEWLEGVIRANPGKTARELRDLVRGKSGSPGCPFDWDGEEDALAANLKPIDLEELIRTRRKRMSSSGGGQKR